MKANHRTANAGPDPSGTMVRSGPQQTETFYLVCLTGHREGRREDVIRWIRKNWDRLGGSLVGSINQDGPPSLKTVADLVDYTTVRKIMEEKDTILTQPLEEGEMNQFVMELTDAGALTKELILRIPSNL